MSGAVFYSNSKQGMSFWDEFDHLSSNTFTAMGNKLVYNEFDSLNFSKMACFRATDEPDPTRAAR